MSTDGNTNQPAHEESHAPLSLQELMELGEFNPDYLSEEQRKELKRILKEESGSKD